MTPSGGRPGSTTDYQAETLPASKHGSHIGMQVASRDRRILMAGDPLQDVQIDTGVGHPCQGGVRLAEAD